MWRDAGSDREPDGDLELERIGLRIRFGFGRLGRGCAEPDASACEADAEALLFGAPMANTGLGSDKRRPSCTCAGGEWTPPSYDDAFLAALDGLELLNPPALLTDDPLSFFGGPTGNTTRTGRAPIGRRSRAWMSRRCGIATRGWSATRRLNLNDMAPMCGPTAAVGSVTGYQELDGADKLWLGN